MDGWACGPAVCGGTYERVSVSGHLCGHRPGSAGRHVGLGASQAAVAQGGPATLSWGVLRTGTAPWVGGRSWSPRGSLGCAACQLQCGQTGAPVPHRHTQAGPPFESQGPGGAAPRGWAPREGGPGGDSLSLRAGGELRGAVGTWRFCDLGRRAPHPELWASEFSSAGWGMCVPVSEGARERPGT